MRSHLRPTASRSRVTSEPPPPSSNSNIRVHVAPHVTRHLSLVSGASTPLASALCISTLYPNNGYRGSYVRGGTMGVLCMRAVRTTADGPPYQSPLESVMSLLCSCLSHSPNRDVAARVGNPSPHTTRTLVRACVSESGVRATSAMCGCDWYSIAGRTAELRPRENPNARVVLNPSARPEKTAHVCASHVHMCTRDCDLCVSLTRSH
jgi:hypothetical protein